MSEKFERHRQPWKPEELQKLRTLAAKGMGLKAIAKALNRTEESTKERAKADSIAVAKLR
ncbi:MAG: hypothetical protein ABIQ66_04785 [Novosphingobium sp.]